MGRKHNKTDRNQNARKNMELVKEAKERIEHNEEVMKSNKESIEELEGHLVSLQEAFEHEQTGDMIKLSGLKVIQPRFEFEQSKEWTEWNEQDVKMSMKRREKEHKKLMKNIEDELTKLREQNERIPKENEELRGKISSDTDDNSSYIG